jgi:hypothetical protein
MTHFFFHICSLGSTNCIKESTPLGYIGSSPKFLLPKCMGMPHFCTRLFRPSTRTKIQYREFKLHYWIRNCGQKRRSDGKAVLKYVCLKTGDVKVKANSKFQIPKLKMSFISAPSINCLETCSNVL